MFEGFWVLIISEKWIICFELILGGINLIYFVLKSLGLEIMYWEVEGGCKEISINLEGGWSFFFVIVLFFLKGREFW